MNGEFLFDFTREMRRRAVRGSLASEDPARARRIEAALVEGRRILIDVEEELLYAEMPVDRVFRSADDDRPIGARRL